VQYDQTKFKPFFFPLRRICPRHSRALSREELVSLAVESFGSAVNSDFNGSAERNVTELFIHSDANNQRNT